MATIDKVEAAVIAYAKDTTYFVTPATVDDPLHPPPAALASEQFSDFYFDLLDVLREHAIKVRLPFAELKHCRTWWHVCVLVHHSQI